MKCGDCGTRIPRGARFCPRCGILVALAEAPPPSRGMDHLQAQGQGKPAVEGAPTSARKLRLRWVLLAILGGVALAGGVVALIALALSGPKWFSPPPFRRPSSQEKAEIRAAFERREPEVTNSVGMEFRLVRKGEPMSGYLRSVTKEGCVATVERDFYISEHGVTVRQYATAMGCRVAYRSYPDEGMRLPREEAHQFCRELSDIEEESYRLASDTEGRYGSTDDGLQVVRALPDSGH